MTTTAMPDTMLALVFGPKKLTTSPLQAVAETAKQVISTVAEKASEAVAAVVEAQVIPLRGGGAAVVPSGDPAVPAMIVPPRKARAKGRKKAAEVVAVARTSPRGVPNNLH